MSKASRNPLEIPKGIEINITGNLIKVKGQKGAIEYMAHESIKLTKDGNMLRFSTEEKADFVQAIIGTTRALVRNMLVGVTAGYEKKLNLKGVGYKAQAQGDTINLNVGFSHPIKYKMPAGITVATPSPTEIVIKGMDKHLVGHVAALIRNFQPPEPYKGKGIHYAGEKITLKEGKKK